MLTDLAIRAAIVDVDGTPLRFTPHDFRRIFATETVNSGLPIHIAAKCCPSSILQTRPSLKMPTFVAALVGPVTGSSSR
jgi:integrase